MKRCIALLLLMLVFTGCTLPPEPTTAPTEPVTEVTTTTAPPAEPEPEEQPYELVVNMADYDSFAAIFEEKSSDDWDIMGDYILRLQGLPTEMVLQMNGRDVMSITAYGHSKDVVIRPVEDAVVMAIRKTETAIVISEDLDSTSRTWIFTPETCFELLPQDGISVKVRTKDGGLTYTRYWQEYYSSFQVDPYAPLYHCTSRDHFLYEKGTLEIVEGQLVMTPTKTVVASDEYKLNTLFKKAKKEGLFTEYKKLNDLLEANKLQITNS